ncbi:flagellar hook-associated protein FlgK [Sulfoacidibacillus thermotolerans]|uniref:Flagellar hook-associated protein 1 n=1 Tax=Sulfoacidibacillus thermotolerans TaxID=1765684 RepID=A0A2U3D7M0_SULT2|nr:flagellar hook-associated protein FlgK [Sulfoacidibacillus thermotolerans]PWI57275.1 flagellar hook-associated protein FlgK [Sulfoacidibacillus thermotolerans]
MSLSTFFGLNIGVSALDTMQQAEDVVANNISNANTPGYVQEAPQLQETTAYPPIPAQDQPIMGGQLGQGTYVSEVTRETNAFVNEQDRTNQSNYSMYQTYHTNLSQIESILNEPSSNSMQNAVDQFFSAWQTLSTDPSNTAARESVIAEAQTLGQTFQTITTQLESLQSNLVGQIQNQVQELNQYASEVAQLNNQIVQINAMNPGQTQAGQNTQSESPNQLLDQRGYILDQMSKLANISYAQVTGDAFAVSIGAGPTLVTLVNGSWTYTPLATATLLPSATSLVTSTANATSPLGVTLSEITSGSIAGNAQGLNYTDQLLANLDSFLSSFASQVNTVQGQGYPLSGSSTTAQITATAGGNTYNYGDLFTSATTASGNLVLSINPLFLQTSGTNFIAASNAPNQPGNNANAMQMINLQTNPITATYTSYSGYTISSNPSYQSSSYSQASTADQYMASLVSNLGVETSAVKSSEATANALAQQSSNLRQSISGVDTNDQAAKMVEYQNSYDAAAKFISVYDQMLQSLINMIP